MDEKKFAVMLTDTQEIKTLECDPQEELFEIARGTIGCEWIELVEAEPLAKDGYLMLIKYNFDVLERDYLPEEKDPRREESPER